MTVVSAMIQLLSLKRLSNIQWSGTTVRRRPLLHHVHPPPHAHVPSRRVHVPKRRDRSIYRNVPAGLADPSPLPPTSDV